MRKKLSFQDLGYGIQILETLRFFKTGVISKDIFFVVISPKSECKNLLFLGGSNRNKEKYHLKFYCLEQRHYQGGF